MNLLKFFCRMGRTHKRFLVNILSSLRDTSNGLKTHHKIFYTGCVFSGVVLVWYALWAIVTAIPVLNHPLVALLVGSGLLFFTGTFFKELG